MNTFVFLALCGAAFEAGCGDVTERLLQQQAPIRPSVCYQPKDTGPCSGHFPRFYYNTTTNTCQHAATLRLLISSSGRSSSPNLRSSTQSVSCQRRSARAVVTFPVTTTTRPRTLAKSLCTGGCQGNANNFPTLNQCETKCGGNYTVEDQSWKKHIMKPGPLRAICDPSNPRDPCHLYLPFGPSVALEDVIRDNPVLSREAVEVYPGCDEPKYPGPCAGHFPRYYFNNASKNCEQFVFGGCQANGNNFESVDECMNRCWVRAYEPTQKIVSAVEVPFWPVAPPEVCTYPPDVGPCKAYMPRFFFNTLTNTCEQFVYGGCGGNANNFLTYDACQKKCMTVFGVIPRA
ncbi:hypothetical protein MRX96_001812 [Rhipicephalus microplus]